MQQSAQSFDFLGKDLGCECRTPALGRGAGSKRDHTLDLFHRRDLASTDRPPLSPAPAPDVQETVQLRVVFRQGDNKFVKVGTRHDRLVGGRASDEDIGSLVNRNAIKPKQGMANHRLGLPACSCPHFLGAVKTTTVSSAEVLKMAPPLGKSQGQL